MNKNEQNRLVAWRLKLLREAGDVPRGVAQTCRHFGLSRKTFYKWRARYKCTVRLGYAIDRESRGTLRGRRPAWWSLKSCTCGTVITLDPAGSQAI
jgi:hypothetical protein